MPCRKSTFTPHTPGHSRIARVTARTQWLHVMPETCRASTSGAVTYNVFVTFNQPPPGLLPGMTADADIIVEDRTDVLTLPRRSIRAKANATIPLPVFQAGETITRNVKIGLVGDLNVEILSGLQEGDRVVTP